MSDIRPDVSELTPVEGGEIVVRFVSPTAFLASAKAGERVQPAAVPTNDFTPSPTSYGASVFVSALLTLAPQQLRERRNWPRHGWATIPVRSVRALAIDVRLSPQDCAEPDLAAAHASLIGVDRKNRPALLRLIEDHLDLAPQP